MFPKIKLGNLTDGMAAPTKGREAQEALTAQAIKEIEQGLGDVGRGADFPMSRSRGGSTSSRGSASNVLSRSPPSRPPPVPAIPAEHRWVPRLPDTQTGDTLSVPKTRRPRSRGASAPGSLAPIEEGHWDHSQIPLPQIPAFAPSPEPVRERSISPWWEDKEPQQEAVHAPQTIQGGAQDQEEFLAVQQPQEVSGQLVQPVAARPQPVHSSSTPAPPTQAPFRPKYSLFPAVRSLPASPASPRFIQMSSATPSSDGSRSSSPDKPNDIFRPTQQSDLKPNNPFGYPAPPPFRHNWDTPNRRSAIHSVNPARARRAGPLGPPVGSRPRPPPPPTLTLQPPSARNSAVATATTATTTPNTTPNTTTAATAMATNGRYSIAAAAAATGQFAYYPMMSPYEAEAALVGGRRDIEERGVDGNAGNGNGNAYENGNAHGNGNGNGNDRGYGARSEGPDAARMFPLLDHEVLSAHQADAAVAANRGVRNTIFVERGVVGGGKVNRSSSCYGDEEEVRNGVNGKEGKVEKGDI